MTATAADGCPFSHPVICEAPSRSRSYCSLQAPHPVRDGLRPVRREVRRELPLLSAGPQLATACLCCQVRTRDRELKIGEGVGLGWRRPPARVGPYARDYERKEQGNAVLADATCAIKAVVVVRSKGRRLTPWSSPPSPARLREGLPAAPACSSPAADGGGCAAQPWPPWTQPPPRAAAWVAATASLEGSRTRPRMTVR